MAVRRHRDLFRSPTAAQRQPQIHRNARSTPALELPGPVVPGRDDLARRGTLSRADEAEILALLDVGGGLDARYDDARYDPVVLEA
jgi:hypothetical protein